MTTKECWKLLNKKYSVTSDDIACILKGKVDKKLHERYNISGEQIEQVRIELERLGRKREKKLNV